MPGHPFALCNRDATYLLELARAVGKTGGFALRYSPLPREWTVWVGNHLVGSGKSPDDAMQDAGTHLQNLAQEAP